MDWLFTAMGGALWLAVYGLVRGCALLQRQAHQGARILCWVQPCVRSAKHQWLAVQRQAPVQIRFRIPEQATGCVGIKNDESQNGGQAFDLAQLGEHKRGFTSSELAPSRSGRTFFALYRAPS